MFLFDFTLKRCICVCFVSSNNSALFVFVVSVIVYIYLSAIVAMKGVEYMLVLRLKCTNYHFVFTRD